jgi:hypothetical protein
MGLAFHARLEMALVSPWLIWRLSRSGPPRTRLAIFCVWTLVIAPLAWLYVDGTSHHVFGWETSRDRAVDFVRAHAQQNLSFFLDPTGALPVLLPLALIGTVAGIRRGILPLTGTAAGLFLFVSAYHSGDFRLSGSDGFRYAVAIAVLLAPAAGWTVAVIVERLTGIFRSAVFAGSVAVLLVPLRSAFPFLARENVVAHADHALRTYLARHPWDAEDVLVSRSVAYSREITGADTIVERCSPRASSSHLWYLRSWNDPGPSLFPGLCPDPVPGTFDPGDGRGPWLFRYGPCTVEVISPAPDGRR